MSKRWREVFQSPRYRSIIVDVPAVINHHHRKGGGRFTSELNVGVSFAPTSHEMSVRRYSGRARYFARQDRTHDYALSCIAACCLPTVPEILTNRVSRRMGTHAQMKGDCVNNKKEIRKSVKAVQRNIFLSQFTFIQRSSYLRPRRVCGRKRSFDLMPQFICSDWFILASYQKEYRELEQSDGRSLQIPSSRHKAHSSSPHLRLTLSR